MYRVKDIKHIGTLRLCGNCRQAEVVGHSPYCVRCVSAMAAISRPWPSRPVIVGVTLMVATALAVCMMLGSTLVDSGHNTPNIVSPRSR